MARRETPAPLAGSNRGLLDIERFPLVDIFEAPKLQDSALDREFNQAVRHADIAVGILNRLGVTFSQITACGGAGCALVATSGTLWDFGIAGKLAIIQPVYFGGTVIDLVAWFPHRPARWWLRRGEYGIALGAMDILAAMSFREPVKLYRSPLSWLRAGGDGGCLLCEDECRSLIADTDIIPESIDHGDDIMRMVRRSDPAAPRIWVPKRRAAA